MPTPKPGQETRDEWMERCVPKVIEDGTAADGDQAVAICSQMWRDANKLVAICPRQGGDEMSTFNVREMATKVAAEHQRAYSVIEVKAVDDDMRIIRGTATTPTPDRAGDVVEPLGVKFSNPLPLLWQHDTSAPIGQAKLGKPTKDGITFEAKIAKIAEPGRLKDRLDEAWQSIKIGLVKGVSIGFKALELSFMKDGGVHFLETEVLELSLVTIPANAEATIESIKAFDQATWDNPLTPRVVAEGATQPGATKSTPATVKHVAIREVKKMPLTILEQISAYETKRAACVARMDELMKKAADASTTLDEAESKEYEDAEADVGKIDVHIKRLNALEKVNKEKAKPVEPVKPNGNGELIVRDDRRITVKSPVPPGIAFARLGMALAAARGNRWDALQRFQTNKAWQDQSPEVGLALQIDIPSEMNNVVKAAIGAGTTTDATWASPLIAYTVMASEFIDYLRPATIIGKFGTGGIPSLRRVPFNIQMPRATAGTSMSWVGENAPKPVTNMAFDTVQLRWAKAAGIVIMTDELVRFSNPSAEAIVRDDMVAAMAQFLDRQFVDPTVAAVTNVSPASITNGVSAISRTGTNQAAWVTDSATLLNTFLTANLSTVGGVWIMSQRQALAFSLMLNSLGQPFYPNINATGGTLMGYPVIASENVPSVGGSPADGTPIIFAIAPEIMLADDGQVVIDASNQASVNMDSAPDSPPTGSTILVSLWQMNMTGLRAERWINWLKRRSTAVSYIQNANYA